MYLRVCLSFWVWFILTHIFCFLILTQEREKKKEEKKREKDTDKGNKPAAFEKVIDFITHKSH